ncbi:hypothetical protein D3C87_1602570 [compost metagenome]
MKNKTITLFTILLLAVTAQAQETKYAKPNFPSVPKLKSYEYAVFIENKYQVFSTEKYDDLEYSVGCIKNKNCQASKAAQDKTAPKYKTDNLFHPAAQFCEARGGKNLIALNDKKEEFNFCRFQDNSMVNSWSMYLKHNPKKIIK